MTPTQKEEPESKYIEVALSSKRIHLEALKEYLKRFEENPQAKEISFSEFFTNELLLIVQKEKTPLIVDKSSSAYVCALCSEENKITPFYDNSYYSPLEWGDIKDEGMTIVEFTGDTRIYKSDFTGKNKKFIGLAKDLMKEK